VFLCFRKPASGRSGPRGAEERAAGLREPKAASGARRSGPGCCGAELRVSPRRSRAGHVQDAVQLN